MLTVLAKNACEIFGKDMYAFGKARRACRKHIFLRAEAPQATVRLLDSNIWGESLFLTDIVEEIRKDVEKTTRCVKTYCKMPGGQKRPAEDHDQSVKRGRGSQGYPRRGYRGNSYSRGSYPDSASSSSSSSYRGGLGRGYNNPAPSYQSPVFNPYFEKKQDPSF